jgi:hypothetical protein
MELNDKQRDLYRRWVREYKLWEESLGRYHSRLKGYLISNALIETTAINIPNEMFSEEATITIEELRANMKRAERRQNLAFWRFLESRKQKA